MNLANLQRQVSVGLLFFATMSCQSSSFSGGSKKDSAQDTTVIAPAGTPAPTPIPQSNNSQPIITPTPMPGAITKGSFTVYTVPANPEPRQDYKIHIEVKLPSGTKNYQRSDLSGTVNGTDNYFRDIAVSLGGFFSGDSFSVAGEVAKLVLQIPGAEVLVKDTIHVRSQLLNEEQNIAIVF